MITARLKLSDTLKRIQSNRLVIVILQESVLSKADGLIFALSLAELAVHRLYAHVSDDCLRPETQHYGKRGHGVSKAVPLQSDAAFLLRKIAHDSVMQILRVVRGWDPAQSSTQL